MSPPARQQTARFFWRTGSLLLVAACVLLAFGLSETAHRRATIALSSLEQRTRAANETQKLLRGVMDAQAAQRGFLLSGHADEGGLYNDSVDEVGRSLKALSAHFDEDPAAQGLMPLLAHSLQQTLSELKATMARFDAVGQQSWRGVAFADIDRAPMDTIRQAATALFEIESGRISDEREQVLRTLQFSRIGIALLVLLGGLALISALRLVHGVDAARQRHARDLLAERDRLERDVTWRTAELTELTSHLQSAREDERGRLARELHDELGALLTAAKIDTVRLKRSLDDAAPAVGERLEHLGATLNSGIALKRRIIEDLRPSSLSHLGLKAALELQAREFEARCDVSVQLTLQPVALSDSAQTTVYRLVQEAMTNIAKYAGARQVQLAIRPEGPWVHVSVRDDGVGFDPQTAVRGSHGLMGMRYRVQAEGGRLHVDAAPGQGTVIEAWLPQQTVESAV